MQQAHEYAASRRGARRGLQAAQHARADPSDAHGPRGRAAALGRRAASTIASSAASTSGAAPRPADRPLRGRPERRRHLLRGRGARAGHARWPTPPSGRRSARATRSGTPRSREAAGRRRRRAGARPLLGAPARESRRRSLLRARQPGHRRARHQSPHRRRRPRPPRGRGRHARHRPDRSSGPRCRWRAGWRDRLRAEGRAVFGPGAAAAQIEASKAFAKDVMTAAGIPTAASRTFHGARARARPTWTGTPSRWW